MCGTLIGARHSTVPWAGSSDSRFGGAAWLEHPTDNREAKGSNPFQPTSNASIHALVTKIMLKTVGRIDRR